MKDEKIEMTIKVPDKFKKEDVYPLLLSYSFRNGQGGLDGQMNVFFFKQWTAESCAKTVSSLIDSMVQSLDLPDAKDAEQAKKQILDYISKEKSQKKHELIFDDTKERQ